MGLNQNYQKLKKQSKKFKMNHSVQSMIINNNKNNLINKISKLIVKLTIIIKTTLTLNKQNSIKMQVKRDQNQKKARKMIKIIRIKLWDNIQIYYINSIELSIQPLLSPEQCVYYILQKSVFDFQMENKKKISRIQETLLHLLKKQQGKQRL
ncbi:unnamed protein product [Paramecium sonneborni]|uniref:Uncharacterized protein n=1 Tax=Paramecium sonneborni TaxID=65129 RepID=A0A8S1R4H9_9CILI|nr:unnamed protein product [Paramecium sonneborni]